MDGIWIAADVDDEDENELFEKEGGGGWDGWDLDSSDEDDATEGSATSLRICSWELDKKHLSINKHLNKCPS